MEMLLKQRLSQPLPGRAAQFKMASLRRLTELGPDFTPPDHARIACVLVLLHRQHQEDAWKLTLIQRSANPHDRHSGQISFPGGSWEEADGSLEAVALRECHEEIGVSPLQVNLVGRLTELYIPVSNFLVHPFVGVLQGQPEFKPQPDEVAAILTPQLTHFQQESNIKTTDITLGNGLTLKNTPYFDVDGHVVWGATAMIISELNEIVTSD